jgi:YD repeat-containing protein
VAETQYTYDGAGRLTRERRADWNLNVDYTLDAAGNRTVLKWPDAFQVTYAYDGANRVTSITGGSTLYRCYAYDVLSRRGSQIAAPGAGGTVGPNSITTTYGYEIDSDLASLVHNYPGSTTDLVYNHTYSASGRLLTTTTSEVLNRYVEPSCRRFIRAYSARQSPP